MNLSDLLEKISLAGSSQIEVKHLTVKHGNADGAGDYQVIVLSFNGQSIRFKASQSGWVLE